MRKIRKTTEDSIHQNLGFGAGNQHGRTDTEAARIKPGKAEHILQRLSGAQTGHIILKPSQFGSTKLKLRMCNCKPGLPPGTLLKQDINHIAGFMLRIEVPQRAHGPIDKPLQLHRAISRIYCLRNQPP